MSNDVMAADPEGVQCSLHDHVATVVLRSPPHNFIDAQKLEALADRLHALDRDPTCRAVVLATDGKSFCAGADFSGASRGVNTDSEAIYTQAMRLFRTSKPIVAALQGPAIGAGAGLALAADFRIGCAELRFSVNFNRLGFHPGFGLSCTLPRLIGQQHAARLFYTGDRINGERALALGLIDELVPHAEVRTRAQALALEIAHSAPLAVQSTRQTLRTGLADAVTAINQRELAVQRMQFASDDFLEGVRAAAERRLPVFADPVAPSASPSQGHR